MKNGVPLRELNPMLAARFVNMSSDQIYFASSEHFRKYTSNLANTSKTGE